ncbi:MAG: phosphoenolpyruvate--protein phosphotransferase [Nocardioidaceae bacterium]
MEVKNPHGLHARPAAKLVATVRAFDARVTLSNPTAASRPPSSAQASANAVSLSQVATLNVRRGDRLLVRAIGPDADDAVAAVVALADRSFDDDPQPASPETAGEPAKPAESGQAPNREKPRSGSGLDFAIGAATLCDLEPDTRAYQPADRETEGQRSAAASAAVQVALTQVREQTERDLGPAEAAIFDAHLSLLADPALEEAVASDLQSGSSALDAWTERLSEVATRLEHLEDAYQRERAQDVRSLQRRMAFALTAPDDASAASAFPANTAAKAPSARDRGILVVPELDPATAATLDLEQVVGIVTRQGGATGHGVIVARSRGIPILPDAGEQVDGIAEGTVIAFDASTRRLWVSPTAEVIEQLERTLATRAGAHASALASAHEPATTTDGCRVTVAANVASSADAVTAAQHGAEGSGLVRTEVLFGGEAEAPSVERQTEAFLAIAAAFEGAPITLRTWDVGGDKPLPYLPDDVAEVNPFLGNRGIRRFRRDPDMLIDQLQAVCRTARETPVQVMFPMIATLGEVEFARDMLTRASARDGASMPSQLAVGIMIEVPAAALTVAKLSAGLDFVSVGTNDLTQYTLAADRSNGAVSGLADAFDPAVLRLIAMVCRDVANSVNVAVCGGLAGDSHGARLLVGLGVRELSVVGLSVPAVKATLREVSLATCERLAEAALAASSADEVRALLDSA